MKHKRFLDTSAVRPTILGTSAYRQYFEQQFRDSDLYVSKYVKMEFRRSFILNLIAFYFTLDLESLPTIGDAFTFWSDKFKGSELKAVLQATGPLFESYKLSTSDPADKPKALLRLGLLIKNYEYLLDQYNDAGVNGPQCARAQIEVRDGSNDIKACLSRFVEKFSDVKACRAKCEIHTFLLSTHRATVDSYVSNGNAMPQNKSTQGFKGIVQNLEEITSTGEAACSCKRCEKIGDLVIALDAPADMTIEHTDSSFNQLCDLTGKKHRQHPSQTRVVAEAEKAIKSPNKP